MLDILGAIIGKEIIDNMRDRRSVMNALFGVLIARYQRRITGIGKAWKARQERLEIEKDERTEARADELLDKVKQDGLASLSEGERQFLVKYSEEQRRKLG